MYSANEEETARMIREVGNHARNTSKFWDKQEWTKRKWLTSDMSAVSLFSKSFLI